MTFGKPPYTVTAHEFVSSMAFLLLRSGFGWGNAHVSSCEEKSQVRGTNILQTWSHRLDCSSQAHVHSERHGGPWPTLFSPLAAPPALWGCWGKFVTCWCEISTSSCGQIRLHFSLTFVLLASRFLAVFTSRAQRTWDPNRRSMSNNAHF